MDDLLDNTREGLWCRAGGFYVDPCVPVERAVITHAHADHARPGCGRYLVAEPGVPVYRRRLGEKATLDAVPYGEPIDHHGVRVSLHPAGHLLGSAQVRIEHRGRVTVVSGDYKVQPDRTCAPFEPVRCDTFITESTFALPVYRWPAEDEEFKAINRWWAANRAAGRTSLLYAYSLGKAQRVLSGLEASTGPILLHGAVAKMTEAYREAGVALPPTQPADVETAKRHRGEAIVIAPISANGSTWTRKFRPYSTGFASGWMQTRGARRRRAVDRGFVISDHADWDGLHEAIEATGCERIGVTHGQRETFARWLSERGYDSFVLNTRHFSAGEDEGEEDGEGGNDGGEGGDHEVGA